MVAGWGAVGTGDSHVVLEQRVECTRLLSAAAPGGTVGGRAGLLQRPGARSPTVITWAVLATA